MPQKGADLGERLANALAHHLELGYRKAVIMNSDGPTLPLAYLEEAFVALDHSDVTLGMGHDGGYYLIGVKQHHPQLFHDIAWSTADVISQTLAACIWRKIHHQPLTPMHFCSRWINFEQVWARVGGALDGQDSLYFPETRPRSYISKFAGPSCKSSS
jgi:glycosyltransferase A (GT-A) superfamily protein (DUF2064 family)